MAGTKQGPADIALVVLRARQRDWLHDQEGVLRVAARACGGGQRFGPGQVVVEQSAGKLVGRAQSQLAQLGDEVARDLGESGSQLMRLLVLVNRETALVAHAGVGQGAGWVRCGEGLDSHERWRHELGIGGDWKTPLAEKGLCRFFCDLGPRCLFLHVA